jgi:hypothetical protein
MFHSHKFGLLRQQEMAKSPEVMARPHSRGLPYAVQLLNVSLRRHGDMLGNCPGVPSKRVIDNQNLQWLACNLHRFPPATTNFSREQYTHASHSYQRECKHNPAGVHFLPLHPLGS